MRVLGEHSDGDCASNPADSGTALHAVRLQSAESALSALVTICISDTVQLLGFSV